MPHTLQPDKKSPAYIGSSLKYVWGLHQNHASSDGWVDKKFSVWKDWFDFFVVSTYYSLVPTPIRYIKYERSLTDLKDRSYIRNIKCIRLNYCLYRHTPISFILHRCLQRPADVTHLRQNPSHAKSYKNIKWRRIYYITVHSGKKTFYYPCTRITIRF